MPVRMQGEEEGDNKVLHFPKDRRRVGITQSAGIPPPNRNAILVFQRLLDPLICRSRSRGRTSCRSSLGVLRRIDGIRIVGSSVAHYVTVVVDINASEYSKPSGLIKIEEQCRDGK